jgi:Domain of unknown function (DUF4337)
MDVDLNDTISDTVREKLGQLNTLVAITVALLATFTGICKVKDDNVVQAMQQAQADKIDHWSWYQSLHVREEVLTDQLALLRLQRSLTDASHQGAYDAAITTSEGLLKHVTDHRKEIGAQANADQEKYDSLNYKDDQFDLSDAMMALAISLLAVTALVQKRWLYGAALVPASIGVLMGLAGLLGWHIHSDFIAALLS